VLRVGDLDQLDVLALEAGRPRDQHGVVGGRTRAELLLQPRHEGRRYRDAELAHRNAASTSSCATSAASTKVPVNDSSASRPPAAEEHVHAAVGLGKAAVRGFVEDDGERVNHA